MSRLTFRTLLALFALVLLAALPATASAKRHARHGGKAAHKADRNRDGLPDRWERRHHLSLRVNQAARDQDRDGARNAAEFAAGTNPRDRDTDDDGMPDGSEDVGTVTSFADGTLVITTGTTGGTPVSGKVTAETEIRCAGDRRGHDEGDDDGHARSSSHGDRGRGGDDEDEDHRDDGDREDCTGGGATAGGMPTAGGLPTTGGLPGAPPPCTVADLKPGALVHEAELKLTANGPVWDEITLVRPVVPTA
jgi:hypothetical protein